MSKLRRTFAPVAAASVILGWVGLAQAQSIEGAIYDSESAALLPGARVTLLFDSDDPQSPDTAVPSNNLTAGQQGQVTGDGGRYRFDLRGIGLGRRLRIEVDVSRLGYSFPSSTVVAFSEPAPSGPVVAGVNPVDADSGEARPYYLRFAPTDSTYQVTNNHIPLDALRSGVEVEFKSSKRRAEVGDALTFSVTIRNRSQSAIGTDTQPAYLRVTPARGIDVISRSARIRVGSFEPFTPQVSTGSSGVRILRFGPMSIPAGSSATFEARASVGVDTRPGRTESRAVLIDAAGVELSNIGIADVHLESGAGLESSTIIGRVFCDDDGDDEIDSSERGVFGARVYLDSGSFAVTDSQGLYHFTRVPEGTRYVKIDRLSLGSSRVRGEVGKLLRLTPGLPGKANFSVRCKTERIAGANPLVTLSHKSRPMRAADPGLDRTLGKRLLIEGDLLLLAIKMDGDPLPLPTATARLDVPVSLKLSSDAGPNLKAVPAGGYGVERPRFHFDFRAPDGVVATRWMFVISEVGSGASKRGATLLTVSGNGAPPAAIDWDGRGSDGKVVASDKIYVAQLVVVGSRAKIEAASALVPFGVEVGQQSTGPSSLTWRGQLFRSSGGSPTATKLLEGEVDALAKTLKPGDKLEVEVHSGSIKSRVEALVTTQERADLIKALLVARGIDKAAVVARGRGVAEPVATGAGAADKNRRVELKIARVTSSNPVAKVPTKISIAASALIDGQAAQVNADGQFRWEGAVPDRRAILVDVQAQDGRRAAIDVELGDGPRRANQRAREVEISADLDKRIVTVGDVSLDASLLDFDLSISSDGGRQVVSAVVPAAAKVKRSAFRFTGASGNTVRVEAKSGRAEVPAGLTGEISVRLVAELEDGSRAYSPRHVIGKGPSRVNPELVINGVAWPIVGGKAKDVVQVAQGGAVLVDVTIPGGQRGLFVVVLGAPSPKSQIGADETLVPSFKNAQSRRGGAPVGRTELLASGAADFWIELPPSGARVPEVLPVRGRARTTNDITINGQAVQISGDGTFTAFVAIDPKAGELHIISEDREGFRAELHWPVKVAKFSVFWMGLGELAVSTSITDRGLLGDTAYLAGMSPDTTWAAGPLLIHGRGTFYLKGELRPARAFKRVRFSVHLDTSKRPDGSAFFEDVLNPVRSNPVIGDSSIEVRDANGRGKVYAKLEADDSEIVVGSLAAELGQGQFFRYGRTIDGAGANLERKIGSATVELDGFSNTRASESARDHAVWRSTGGTLYYLRFADVVEGSELLRVIIRDRDTGIALSDKKLRRNVDYTIDYLSGRVWLINPIPSYVSSQWVLSNRDASLAPTHGNPTYIEARYEHRDPSGTSERAAGFEARFSAKGLSASLGAAGEWRDASDDYTLWGGNASYSYSERSRVWAEVARAKRRSGASFISIDGGLNYRDLAWNERGENPLDESGTAWRVGGRAGLGDFSHALEGSELELYAQSVDRNFSAMGSELERGRLKLGGTVRIAVGDRNDILVRHQADVTEVPRIGPTDDDVASDLGLLDERATFLTSVGWRGRHGRFEHQLEAAHQRLTSTASRMDGTASLEARRLGVGGRTSVDLTQRVSLSAFQEVWTAADDIDPVLKPIDPMNPSERTSEPLAGVTSGVGLAWQLLPHATFTSELRQRWNGDQAAAIGVRAKLSELGSFYVAERAVRSDDGPSAVTVIGAEDRFGPSGLGRTYGEYQIENSGSGTRNRAVLGLGRRWRITPEVGVGVGFEHQQIFGGFLPDGTPVGNNQRDLVRGSLELAPSKRIRAGVVVELRADRGADSEDIDRELIDADPRDPSGGGFGDHGGVAPGAPLVLSSKDLTQVVGSVGVTWRPQEGVSLFTRGRGARTWSGPSIGFSEVTTGLAYRSLLDDRLALLLRYTFLRERRPEATDLAREQAHVLAAVPVADLSKRWRLSGKAAFKRSEASGGIAEGETVSAVLALARIGYRVYGNWDATLEGRGLLVSKNERELKLGTLVELGYYFDEFFRLGLGYNFSHFNDQELGDLTRDAHGLFLRLTAEI